MKEVKDKNENASSDQFEGGSKDGAEVDSMIQELFNKDQMPSGEGDRKKITGTTDSGL